MAGILGKLLDPVNLGKKVQSGFDALAESIENEVIQFNKDLKVAAAKAQYQAMLGQYQSDRDQGRAPLRSKEDKDWRKNINVAAAGIKKLEATDASKIPLDGSNAAVAGAMASAKSVATAGAVVGAALGAASLAVLAFGAAVVANSPGMNQLGKATTYLFTTIGSALSPVIILLAGVLIGFADIIKTAVETLAGGWQGVIEAGIVVFSALIKATLFLTSMFLYAAGALMSLAGKALSYIPGARGMGRSLKEGGESMSSAAESLGNVDMGKIEGAIKGGMKTAGQSLRADQSSKVQTGFSGIADVWKQIQQSTFQDPIAAKQLEAGMRAADGIDRLNSKLENFSVFQ